MAYRRFAFARQDRPGATPATLATPSGLDRQTVADVASVAAPPAQTLSPFGAELASLLAGNPTNNEWRWLRACDDASLFLRQWGEQASALSWLANDLFGVHPLAPL